MDERELVERAKAGSAEAVSRLVERHQDPLYAFLYRFVGHEADAEDLCQEVFVKALRNLKTFEGGSRFRTWLFAIAANAARDRLRRRRRENGRAYADESELARMAAPARSDPETVVIMERRDAVHDAIAALPPRERVAVILSTWHELSYAEIGGVIECSPNAVGSLLCRARKRLASRLADWADS